MDNHTFAGYTKSWKIPLSLSTLIHILYILHCIIITLLSTWTITPSISTLIRVHWTLTLTVFMDNHSFTKYCISWTVTTLLRTHIHGLSLSLQLIHENKHGECTIILRKGNLSGTMVHRLGLGGSVCSKICMVIWEYHMPTILQCM